MRNSLLVFFSFIIGAVHAQTAGEIIQKYADKLGGLEAFNKIKTAKITISATNTSIPIFTSVTQLINGKSVHVSTTQPGQRVIECYHNGKAWAKDSATKQMVDITRSDTAWFYRLKSKTYLADELMDHKARGHQVELSGKEMVGDDDCYKIKLTDKDTKKETTFFIRTGDYSLKEFRYKQEGTEYAMKPYSYQTINGLSLCVNRNLIERLAGNRKVDVWTENITIELDVKIDEKIFEKK